MIHQSVTPFGARPVSACLLQGQRLSQAPTPTTEVDKWALFQNLRKCRAAFGVTNRDLVVLNALLTFHPDKLLTDGAQLVVFPSNASLSDRAHGMAESTLRRHLAALVTAKLIVRNDSPNGKRFAARNRSGKVLQAYGFDLRPLLVQANKIATLANAADDEALTLRLARQSVVTKLRDIRKMRAYATEIGLYTSDSLQPDLDGASQLLRRKLPLDVLQSMALRMGQILEEILAQLPQQTDEMSGYDAQNERDHQISDKEYLDSEPSDGDAQKPPHNFSLNLEILVKACPDIETYSQGKIRSWWELGKTAHLVYPMMGISKSAWELACDVMGQDQASGVLAAMLQRVSSIRQPGGYLRKLVQKFQAGAFSLHQMIFPLLNSKPALGV